MLIMDLVLIHRKLQITFLVINTLLILSKMEMAKFLSKLWMIIYKIKKVPQYLFFRCGMTHWSYSLMKSEKTFKLQKEFSEKEVNHDDNDENCWRDKKDVWVD